MENRALEGRTAIITGAGSGIGRAIAARFLREGASVVLAEHERTAGEDARDELSQHGRVHLEVTDIADESAGAAMIAAALSWGKRLDILVNNAGFFGAFGTPIESLELATWRRTLDVNLSAPFLLAKHAARHLRVSRGTILNITSTRAVMSERHTEAYAASKGGLSALTHALAISLAPEVRVNAIAPGWIATDAWKPRSTRSEPKLRPEDHAQHPVGRVGRPEDVASLAVYLVSAEAAFITGQIITADGGMTRKMIYVE